MKKVLAVATISMSLMAGVAMAESTNSVVDEAVASGTLNGFYVGAYGGVDAENNSLRDHDGIVGLNGGYDFGRYRLDLDLRTTHSGDNTAMGEVDTVALIGGAYYDVPTGTNFTPFVGVNLGYVYADGVGVVGGDDSEMIWGGTAGMSYTLTSNWDLVGQYQYLHADDLTIRTGDGREDYTSQAVTAGVRYKF